MAMLLPGGRGAVEIGKAWPSFHRYAMGGAYGLRLAGSRADVAGLVSFFAPVEFSGVPYEGAPMGTCCNFSESATARSVDLVVEFAARLPD